MSLIDAIAVLAADSDIAVVITDGQLSAPGPTILFVNAAFERMSGFSAADMVGVTPRRLQGPATSLAARKQLARALRIGRRQMVVLVNYRANGEPYHCELDVHPIRDRDDSLTHAIAFEREVQRRAGRIKARTA